jgi:hypothetical protein
MKAAIVIEAGQAPVYGDFRDPVPAPGKSLIRVTASSISHVTKSRASAAHYSSDGALPFIPGIDGTGIGEDGQRVYFLLPEKPYGAMAEFCIVDDRHRFAIPEGLSEDSAAAMTIPGMSSWAALVERANLRAGETVLINGATGTSGRLAIQIAKHLGARKVIATGRQTKSFDDLRLVGDERGDARDRRCEGRPGGGSDPLRPDWLDQRDEHQPARRSASVVRVAAHGQRDRKHPVPKTAESNPRSSGGCPIRRLRDRNRTRAAGGRDQGLGCRRHRLANRLAPLNSIEGSQGRAVEAASRKLASHRRRGAP